MTSRLKTIYVVWTFLMIMGVPGLSWGGSIAGNLTVLRAPSGLTAMPMTSRSIFLSWTDNSGNETGFKIERSFLPNGFFDEIATVGANTRHYTNGDLLSGTRYYYRVRAFNSSVHSSYSNSASAKTPTLTVLPSAPSALGATTMSASSIKLTWTDNSNNETGFRIERSLHENSGFEQIRTTAANTTSYTNTGLSASTTYYYRVRATHTSGDSAYTDVAHASTPAAVPSAPIDLTAMAISPTQINLVWRDNSNNETGFKIQRSTSSSGGFTDIHTTAANTTIYSDTGLTAGTKYYYRVRATNSAGDSAYSNKVNATTQPLPPPVEEGVLRLINDMNSITVNEANAHWGSDLDARYISGSVINSILTVRVSHDELGRNADGLVELSEFEDELLEPVGAFCQYTDGSRIPNRSMEVIQPGNDREDFDVDGGRYYVVIEMGYYGRDPDRSREEDGYTCYKKYPWYATWVEINQTEDLVELSFCENFIGRDHADFDFLCD